MPAARPCPVPGCPALTSGGRCPQHRREADRARGTRQERGYDSRHEALRRAKAAEIASGKVVLCSADVCLMPDRRISPGQVWHLDHTDDRTGYRGPSHERCNTSAGGRASHE